MKDKIRLAIIGATGLVGQAFIHLIASSNNIINYKLNLYASINSKEQIIKVGNIEYQVNELNEESFNDSDYALFFSTPMISKTYIPIALKHKCIVIDNSAYYRLYDNVPLVIVGINENKIQGSNLIANPNCSTIQSLIPIAMLKDYGIKRIIYNTYQSVSGSGKKGIDDLIRCRKGLMPIYYDSDISFTCIPKIGEYEAYNYTDEEMKMVKETRKILDNENIKVTATCVRVPTMFAHGVTILIELTKEIDVEEIIKLFRSNKNIVVCDEILPTSVLACNTDSVYIGRIRKDISSSNGLIFYCVADNIRIGAATNALNILNYLINKKGNDNNE